MEQDQIQELVSVFGEIKTGWGNITKRLDQISQDHTAFAGSVNERLSVLAAGAKYGSDYRQPLAEVLMQNKAIQERPAFNSSTRMTATFQAKDILNVSTQLPTQDRTIHGGPRQELRFRDLLPSTQVSAAGSVEYVRETGFTNLAAVVAEGAAKPKSDKTFAVENAIFRTLAHYFKISRQTWLDLPELAEALASNLIYGLGYKLEQQLLKGAGGATELQGIYPLATAATALPAPGTGEPPNTLIDAIFAASAQLTAAGFPPDGGAISPADWSVLQRLKDSTGRYILQAAAPALPRLVVSPFLAAGEWIIGAFGQQSRLYVREEAHVMVATMNEDDFTRNLVTMLGEMRAAPVWYQLGAFLKNPGA